MAERFRFRLSWLTAPRPADEEQQPPPPVETQPPVRPATTIPVQQPPFRPTGIAQAQAPPRNESQPAVPSREATQAASMPPSPSRAGRESSGIAPVESPPPQAQAPPRAESQAAATESQVTTQTKSPPRATVRTQATTVSPSPTRAGPQSRSTSQPASPSRAAPQSRAAPVPPSPTRTTPQVRPARQTPPQPQSSPRSATQQVGKTSAEPYSPSKMGNQAKPTVSQPSSPKNLQLTTQETSQPSPQKDTKLATFLQVSEAPQLKTEIASEIESVPKSQNQTESLQASTIKTVSAPTFRQAPETSAASEKPDSSTGADHAAHLSHPLKKLVEAEEGKKVAELLKNAEKNGSVTEGKELPDATLDIDGMPHMEAIFGRKKKAVISSSREQEQVKLTNMRNTTTQSHRKPVTSTGGKADLHREIREDVSRFVHKKEAGYPMQPIGENPVSIVTLAGENKGANMHLGNESARKEEPVHILRGYKINPYDSTDSTRDGKGISNGRKSEDELTKEEPTTRTYINSNSQSINNSIVFDSSVNERNPGVQLTISQKPTEPANSTAQPGRLHTRKAEFNIIPAGKHTYETTVRRRCLRGLLLESSDSDPGNPEKPRRHGCRYSCREKSKDKDTGVFWLGERQFSISQQQYGLNNYHNNKDTILSGG